MAVPPASSPVQITIKKPSTSNDTGTLSKSCAADIKRVFRFIEDERHLIAHGLYQDVVRRTELAAATDAASKKPPRLRKSKASAQRDEQAKDVQEAEEIMASKRDVLDHLVVRLSCVTSVSNLDCRAWVSHCWECRCYCCYCCCFHVATVSIVCKGAAEFTR